ncbi:unnamed protein product, partial [Allacma fusca]
MIECARFYKPRYLI